MINIPSIVLSIISFILVKGLFLEFLLNYFQLNLYRIHYNRL